MCLISRSVPVLARVAAVAEVEVGALVLLDGAVGLHFLAFFAFGMALAVDVAAGDEPRELVFAVVAARELARGRRIHLVRGCVNVSFQIIKHERLASKLALPYDRRAIYAKRSGGLPAKAIPMTRAAWRTKIITRSVLLFILTVLLSDASSYLYAKVTRS